MRIFLKSILIVGICIVLLELLYLREYRVHSKSQSFISTVYSKPGYKYWNKFDGARFCNFNDSFDSKSFEQAISPYLSQRSSVVYFSNTEILLCQKYIPEIAKMLHKKNLSFAINLETKLDYRNAFKENFTSLNLDYYNDKFKDSKDISNWVDYIVVDNAMEYFTFEDRHNLFVELRKIFPKPALGFRFTKHYGLDKDQKHPIRSDKFIEEFWPADDDGDFIITSIKVDGFKRTQVIIEDKSMDKINVDGEFRG